MSSSNEVPVPESSARYPGDEEVVEEEPALDDTQDVYSSDDDAAANKTATATTTTTTSAHRASRTNSKVRFSTVQQHVVISDDEDEEDNGSVEESKDFGVDDSSSSLTKQNSSLRRRAERQKIATVIQYGDLSYQPGKQILPYYPPHQRQRWGETQVLPRVDWGDLFYDLFFVSGTYNVSNILVKDPSWTGLLYASGTFLPIMSMWVRNTYYAARFTTSDDLYHRVQQILLLVILGATVLHIRPTDIMEDARNEISMFSFALTLCLEQFVMIVRNVELYFKGVGQREVLKQVALRDLRFQAISLTFYGAAVLLATLEFFPRQDSDNEGYRLVRGLAGGEENSETYDGSAGDEEYHIPIGLCLAGFAASILYMSVEVVFFYPKGGKHKEFTVPLNVDFYTHRYGEWTMLMLGESIFSIIIVDVSDENKQYFGTFYASLLTVILLQYLHFKSQPHHADGHAVRRSKDAGIGWMLLVHIYSFSLVCLGAAYTFFLTDFESKSSDSGEKDSSHYVEDDPSSSYGENEKDGTYNRFLAGGGEASDDVDKDQAAANLFAYSLAICFLCLDGMTMFHVGLQNFNSRCYDEETRRLNYAGCLLLFLRVALLVFTATLAKWETEPEKLSVLGFTCVVVQLILRKMGNRHLTEKGWAKSLSKLSLSSASLRKKGNAKRTDSAQPASWPNVTTAVANNQFSEEDKNSTFSDS